MAEGKKSVMLRKWTWVSELSAWVCVPAKNGGTAFYRHVFNVPSSVPSQHVFGWVLQYGLDTSSLMLTPPQVSRMRARKILAWRHPDTRFESLWRSKCRDYDSNLAFMHGWTPLELALRIQAAPLANEHWAAQMAYAVPDCDFMHYTKLSELLNTAFENSTHESSERMPEDIVREIYAADFDMIERYALTPEC